VVSTTGVTQQSNPPGGAVEILEVTSFAAPSGRMILAAQPVAIATANFLRPAGPQTTSNGYSISENALVGREGTPRPYLTSSHTVFAPWPGGKSESARQRGASTGTAIFSRRARPTRGRRRASRSG